MKRPENMVLRGETRLFLSILLAIILSVFAAANAFAAPFAYITNAGSNNVSVIDTATNTVVATIPVGAGPVGVAVNPSGTRLYVTNRGSGTVSVIDTNTNAVVTTIPVGSGPVGVAVNPSGTRLYVTNFNSNTVSVIDTATNAVVATIPVGSAPNDVAVNPSGTRLYVVNHLSSTVSVIDASTNSVVTTIPVGSVPVGVAVNPSGTRVYVTSDYIGKVSVIDTSTNTVVVTISVGSRPQGVAVNPSDTRLYVANYGSNTVSVIDTATNTVVTTIPVGSGPLGVAVNPSGTRVYVANNGSNTVSVIDTATNTVVATIPVGSGPAAFGKFIGPGEQSCVEPPAGLVSWWPGDGDGDDIIDGNPGTLQNGVTFAAGKVGQAFSFDGVNDEVKVPYAANLNPTQALTLGAWVNINSLTNAANGGYQGVVSMSEGQRAYFFGITGTGSNHMGTAGNVHLEGFGLGSAHRTSAAVITPGQWYHIAGVIEPSTNRFEIYVNGVLQPAVSSRGGPQLGSVSNVPFRIGYSDPGFPYHFNGLIDEVEIYNRALAAAEIQAIYNAGSAGMCKGAAPNSAPVANAGQDQTPYVGNTVTLDGSGSYDVDGNLLTYSWSFTSKPQGSAALLVNPTSVNPTFTVDKAGTYVVSLTVNDGTVDSAADTVTISTLNSAPVANAGNDQTVPEESTVTLDGSGSSDADGDTLTYSWAFTTKPAESTATLGGTTTVNPTFTADEKGTYVVSLIVNDGTVNSSPDTVTITANEAPEEEIEVEVSIKPETINLKSKGKFKAFIELPEPYSADEVVLATVVCEGAHAIDGRVDGEDRYIATFNTQDLRITVSSKEEEVTITVTGELEDGTKFTGSDTVKVKGK